MIELIFSPWLWLTIGIVLIVIEILMGVVFFLLPPAFGAIAVSILLFIDSIFSSNGTIIFARWEVIIFLYCALSLISAFLVKKYYNKFNSKLPPDPNDYERE